MVGGFLILGCLVGVGSLPIAGIAALRARYQRGLARELVTYRLTFPRDLETTQVVEIMKAVTGLLRPWQERTIRRPSVAFELQGDADGVHHDIRLAKRFEQLVMPQVRRVHPGITTERQAQEAGQPGRWDQVRELRLSNSMLPLGITSVESFAAALVTACAQLEPGEGLLLQCVVAPAKPARKPTAASNGAGDRDDVNQARQKLAGPQLQVVVRLAARAADDKRANQLLTRLVTVLQTARKPGVYFRRRCLPVRLVTHFLNTAQLPVLAITGLLSLSEAAALSAFPAGGPQLPGLHLTSSRQLAPVHAIPTVGRVIARSTFPGTDRNIAIGLRERLRHQYIIGQTGTGKSTLMENEVIGDLDDGLGLALFDPNGDTYAHVVDRVPEHRMTDVVILDPTDTELPVSVNLLAGAHDDPVLATSQILDMLHNLYEKFWGPRTNDILRNALLTLTHEPGMTLCEVPLLLTDDGFRRRVVGKLADPIVLEPFWADYNDMTPAERRQAIGPVMNKLRDFLADPMLRNIIGQGQAAGAVRPRLDMAEVLAQDKILLVRLPKGKLGKEKTALLGSLTFRLLWNAAQARIALPEAERRPFMVYADEFQDLLSLAGDFAELAAQGRKYGIGLVVAHQYLAQVPREVQQAVLANTSTKTIFQTSAHDAAALASELKPHINAEDIQNLGNREVMIWAATAEGSLPVTGRTLDLIPSRGTAGAVESASRARYGEPRLTVERRILARHVRGPGGRARVRREHYEL
jgi:hypothetical protein